MEHKVMVVGIKNVVIDAIVHHVENTDGLKLVGFVETTAELEAATLKRKPDCIFICPSIFDTLSAEGCIEFLQKYSTFNLLVATVAIENKLVSDWLAGGVKGVLLIREVDIDELLTAINKVALGGHYISNGVAERLRDGIFKKTQNTAIDEILTEREAEVSRLIADGLSSKEIARMLLISPATVNVHRRNIMLKTGVRKAAALAKLVHTAAKKIDLNTT